MKNQESYPRKERSLNCWREEDSRNRKSQKKGGASTTTNEMMMKLFVDVLNIVLIPVVLGIIIKPRVLSGKLTYTAYSFLQINSYRLISQKE